MNEQLLDYLFDNKPHVLVMPMSRWLDSSRRFQTFVTTHRDKIRKKIRVTQNDAGIKGLEVELETAYWLLEERRFAVAYEPYSSEKTRGPDFAVTFKSMTFNVEVTRIRPRKGDGQPAAGDGELPWLEPHQIGDRLVDTVCDKLGQMRPGMMNVLIVYMDGASVRLLDIYEVMARLKERAEKEGNLFGRYNFVNRADFFKYYLRLSTVLVRAVGQQDGAPVSMLWINKQAKHSIPGSIQTILRRK